LNSKIDTYLIFIKIKSYLVSLLDDPSNEIDSLELTEEFLDRKYPEHKEYILEMLVSNNILSDEQIAFDENILTRFKDIASSDINSVSLEEILKNFNIESIEKTLSEKSIQTFKKAREQKTKEIITILFQLARIWSYKTQLENEIDDYSLLEEEELIRPEEEFKLDKLDDDTNVSFGLISKLTNIYLEQLVSYFFDFGGNVSLANFINNLETFKKLVHKKYSELFQQYGLNQKEK
jgi:hypothetical protein